MSLKEGQLVNIQASPVLAGKHIEKDGNNTWIEYKYLYSIMIYYNKEPEPVNLPVSKTGYTA